MLLASCWSLAQFLLQSWRRWHVLLKCLLTFSGLSSIISQETGPYISVLWGT
jgi:hypothetical protein